jgi:hypothetical protein
MTIADVFLPGIRLLPVYTRVLLLDALFRQFPFLGRCRMTNIRLSTAPPSTKFAGMDFSN